MYLALEESHFARVNKGTNKLDCFVCASTLKLLLKAIIHCKRTGSAKTSIENVLNLRR